MGLLDAVLPAYMLDAGGWVHNLDNDAFGGIQSGAWDAAFLNAVNDMPAAGGIIVIPPRATAWVFNSVDLSSIGKAHIRVIALGATIEKAATTPSHMFKDLGAKLDRFAWIGGKVDLKRASFVSGNTVSFFHGIRQQRLLFAELEIFDGIEEGLKIYKPQKLRVLNCEFRNIRNQGVQCHAPNVDTGYVGSRADQDTEDVHILGNVFDTIDDGLDGTSEGQGVGVSAASTTKTAKRVWVCDNVFRACIRAAWAEFNQVGLPGEQIHFDRNVVDSNRWHGIGLIGTRASTANGNTIKNVGYRAPGAGTSSEVLGMILSGSADPRGQDNVVVDNTIIETRTGAAAFMQYGLRVINQDRATARHNRIRGMTVQDLYVEWGTGKVLKSDVQRGSPPAAKAKLLTTGQTVANNTWADLSPNTQVFDTTEYLAAGTGGMWTSGTPTRITFKEPGRYMIGAAVVWPSNSTGLRGLRLYTDDGTTSVLEVEVPPRVANNGDDHGDCLWALVEVTEAQVDAGRWFHAQVFQTSGGNLTTAIGEKVWMEAHRIGPLDAQNF